jgi:eukaryotic-like serine/threonine-protein kinase
MKDTASGAIGRRYQILGTLGQGGMGTVLLAKDRLDGHVALKRLSASAEGWKGALKNLVRADAPTPELLATLGAVGEAVVGGDATLISDGAPPLGDPASGIGTATTVWSESGVGDSAPGKVPSSTVVPTVGSGHGSLVDVLRLTLAREFRLLSSLRHPNIISVLDYGFDEELSPYFTMELLEGASTILAAGSGAPVAVKVGLIAQMLQALAYLHRRGVIHRDLKPGNVMVVDGRVKVLDFGVSTLRERDVHRERFIVGTLAYMAPEVLMGAPATEASDLYAVGVIAYELFAGRYPFDTRSVSALRDEILHKRPSLDMLDERVSPIIGALLAKRPEERPESVDDVLAALADRTGQALAVETAATRESFLQAAELVGRDAELIELAMMLADAAGGRGGGALVGGESGVGKSRLIDELRARALVDGVVVLRGQTEREGGPYHAFREVLRGLVLRVEPDDFEAAVLSAVVPDLASLLGREVRPRAALDPEAAHARLFSAIEALLLRHREPTLVLLEDLQWAGSESLRLLAEIARTAQKLPLLFVGTYRDDERPGLPSDVPGVRTLKLRRLGGEGIAALAASMLGEAGRRPEVISRLTRETEGNPFFLVEVVRALAEDAGALSRVGVEPMPKTVAPGGMHLIVRRRLDQVPRRARPLLEVAAVIGRAIDPALMQRVEPGVDLDAWIETCADVAVLEVAEKSYRFAHDKLREGLLAELDEAAARALHRRVAEAIEAEYPGSAEHTAALSRHWALAGDEANEAKYAALAGEQALQSSAYREAVAYFERAIAIVSGGAAPRSGGLVERARQAVASIATLGRAPVPTTSDRYRLGLWEGRLSEAYGRLSNHAESFRRGERALAHLGLPMPSGNLGLALGLPVQAAKRALMSAAPMRFSEPSADARAVLLEATRIQTRVTEACFYTQESLPMMWSGLSLLNLGEPAGPSADLACGYAIMAAVAGVIPLHAAAEAWSRRAMSLVESVGKPYDVAFVLQRVSSYRLWMGEWRVAEDGFAREIGIAREVGDQRLLGDAMICSVFAATYQGKFARVVELFRELNPWMVRTADAQLLCGGRIAEASVKVRLGQLDEALALLEEARPLADASAASHDDIRCYGALALAAQRAGDEARAREAARHALQVIGATRPVAYWTYDGIAAVAEATTLLWEKHRDAEAAKLASDALRGAEAYAGIFPIGKPFSLLWRGLHHHVSGRPDKARDVWLRCVAEAYRLGMPYDEARAHLEIGRHLSLRDPARRGHLTRAAAIFAELHAVTDHAQAEAEIARG